MSTRELIENYTAYTDALELSHSAAGDDTARSTPVCIALSIAYSVPASIIATFTHSC